MTKMSLLNDPNPSKQKITVRKLQQKSAVKTGLKILGKFIQHFSIFSFKISRSHISLYMTVVRYLFMQRTLENFERQN